MKKVIDFLSVLRVNNNREWFEANRKAYTEALSEFNEFTERLIAALAAIDPSVAGLTVKDCTYRIYRDARFSHNKDPYKAHMGAYVCPKGKKSGYSGYYFHVEPAGGGYLGNSLLAVGLYCPQPNILKSLRDEIFDNGDKIIDSMDKAAGFKLEESSKLMRVPKGYPADSPYAEYLKLKDISLYESIEEDLLLSPHLLERTVEEFSKTVEFNRLLNRAVAFAHENM